MGLGAEARIGLELELDELGADAAPAPLLPTPAAMAAILLSPTANARAWKRKRKRGVDRGVRHRAGIRICAAATPPAPSAAAEPAPIAGDAEPAPITGDAAAGPAAEPPAPAPASTTTINSITSASSTSSSSSSSAAPPRTPGRGRGWARRGGGAGSSGARAGEETRVHHVPQTVRSCSPSSPACVLVRRWGGVLIPRRSSDFYPQVRPPQHTAQAPPRAHRRERCASPLSLLFLFRLFFFILTRPSVRLRHLRPPLRRRLEPQPARQALQHQARVRVALRTICVARRRR